MTQEYDFEYSQEAQKAVTAPVGNRRVALTEQAQLYFSDCPQRGADSVRFWRAKADKMRDNAELKREYEKRATAAAKRMALCNRNGGRKPLDRDAIRCRYEEGVVKSRRKCRCAKCRGVEYDARTESRRAKRKGVEDWVARQIAED